MKEVLTIDFQNTMDADERNKCALQNMTTSCRSTYLGSRMNLGNTLLPQLLFAKCACLLWWRMRLNMWTLGKRKVWWAWLWCKRKKGKECTTPIYERIQMYLDVPLWTLVLYLRGSKFPKETNLETAVPRRKVYVLGPPFPGLLEANIAKFSSRPTTNDLVQLVANRICGSVMDTFVFVLKHACTTIFKICVFFHMIRLVTSASLFSGFNELYEKTERRRKIACSFNAISSTWRWSGKGIKTIVEYVE